ncbi:MAG: acetylglutamate kinase [Geminicoccaceae bacterium]
MTEDDHHQIARTLVEALPYMRQFAGSTFVIKYGGHAMGSAELARDFARDVVLLKQVGINPVVVHGGGPQIKAMLDRLKIQSEFVQGLRVTDAATVEIVEMVLAGNINKQIVTAIQEAGGPAVGLSGKDSRLIQATKLTRKVRDAESHIEEVLDLGFVGQPETINTQVLDVLRESALIPVIAPIGIGDEGQTYNINADTAAGALASALNAQKLIMLTDVAGVLDAEGELMPRFSVERAKELMTSGVITGGMIPKLETCLSALENGVEAVHILDGRLPHVLLLEIFTEVGVGTKIG